MHRNQLLGLLETYIPTDQSEESFRLETLGFVRNNPDCFDRNLQKGHITGSAWIIDNSQSFTLLTHHQKLDNWFQPGGHCDGESDVLNVALREAEEETGIKSIDVQNSSIFDIDIHLIPEHKGFPAHWHYDIRFLFTADRNIPLVISSESRNLAWIPLCEVHLYNNSASLMRMVKKTQ
jgi:8-oxo-dGTP pyrophosphatase MutT (NUDIX family)